MANENNSDEYLKVTNLVKWFGDDPAVDNISFSIPEGSFLTLLGPSGCGKTTTLMSIAGLHAIDSGHIQVGDLVYTSPEDSIFLPPEQRDIGMVFQSYAIWPHMTVTQNVAYPLDIRKVHQDEIDSRVADVLELVGLTDMADKMATQLSGGQQQRASLARAIVSKPRLLLFDEPLSNLDLKLREQMRVELKRIQHEVGITSVFVTHDQAEALVMSDEIIVMSKGHIEQRGGPLNIYSQPLNRYVSNFIGVANLLKGRVAKVTEPGRGEVEVEEGGKKVLVPCLLGDGISDGAEAVLSVRPENVHALREDPGDGSLEGEVIQVIFLGNYVDCRVSWGEFEWKVIAHPRDKLREGEKVYLRLDADHTLAVRP
ncbi:MAG: ABC transporter ATP-binding protein [Rhodospirillaceae bacterium]|jgi:iron(III) transport system ATP-binding protein|nr:ABC transporter ATP-binding protein [Rhodospirillales bacterium]MBT3904802.1 ABC transporter ATP-binding protein [Rhodospirillaceae bacterium]MBT4700532.1 ABC transporter ATP-binding protein [Rhodospirillaceae bacterium]MBT5035593.1 ABC transporter ATP-binding protein [Rhodospirillaceae bacterium]MBT6219422.1 ABC transporter ATP-binding protein [Rhodospirillaceae bacterium]